MSVCIETYKHLNLVDFLADHYGLTFRKSGSGYVARSPFGVDKRPSFFVRKLGNHWLFKDFSSGLGGSIIDLVGHLEQLSGVGAILRRLEDLAGGHCASVSLEEKPSEKSHGYDVDRLYHRFRVQDPDVCRRYLLNRGIEKALVEDLINEGEVLHNHYQGKSYCCFAVRNSSGHLECLDNHEIGGPGKFVLGSKGVYSRDWKTLSHATEVFITEGIIDYLSIKTLEGNNFAGLALLGNQLIFDPSLLLSSPRIISALDEDRGGMAAFVDLVDLYPGKEITRYPLQNCKDPNELLQSGNHFRRLSPEDKLSLYRAFQRSDNRSELAREWGLDRSHMYAIVRDVEEMVIEGLSSRRPGRKPTDQPPNLTEAWHQIDGLKEQNRNLTLERDASICRQEFLKIRLKWSEIEAAELRGEPIKPGKKKQIKKKRKKKR